MKRNYVFSLLVGLLLIFTLTACGEKMPTKCPSYIDLSLEREIALLENIYPETERIDVDDLIPEGVHKLQTATRYGGDKQVVYITPDNVLYLVDYRMREVQGELYKYVTKMAVREGDRYIYKADNWSNDGLMVAEYNDTYYDYFNKYKESQGLPTQTPPENREDTYPSLPSYVDHSFEKCLKQTDRVLNTDFNGSDNPTELAQRFLSEGATVYDVSEKYKADGTKSYVQITYITAEGVYYRVTYSDEGIIIATKKVSDNYVYRAAVNLKGELVWSQSTSDANTEDYWTEYFDLWCKERGVTPAPNTSVFNIIFRSGAVVWHADSAT